MAQTVAVPPTSARKGRRTAPRDANPSELDGRTQTLWKFASSSRGVSRYVGLVLSRPRLEGPEVWPEAVVEGEGSHGSFGFDFGNCDWRNDNLLRLDEGGHV